MRHSSGCALYMRLSREDDKGTESASIETQRKILRSFAAEGGFDVYGEYVDDGYSGTSLDRPAFRRMLADIEAGKIGVVLTKDLSRLGRNSGRVSILVDEYFPAHRVRYISVGEGFDSARPSPSDCIVTPVQNFANELYAADISNKIRAALNIKMRQGEYIGAFAPYGYRKDPQNKNRLIPDPEAAENVRRIFSLCAQGHSPSQIAELLNAEKVPTPSRYRLISGGSAPQGVSAEWKGASVGKLLRNEVYLGRTVQGKTGKPSFKSPKSQSRPREDWIVVEGTHEALVSPRLWDEARARLSGRAQKRQAGFVNIFSGIAKCADCGRSMSTVSTRKKGCRANLCCGGYKQGGPGACTCHTIDYDLLCDAVLAALRESLRPALEEKELLLEGLVRACPAPYEAQLHEQRKKLETIDRKLACLYDDRYSGNIRQEQFRLLRERYEREKALCEERLSALRARSGSLEESEDAAKEKYSRLIDEYCRPDELTAPLLFGLVRRIDVHQGEYTDGVKHQKIVIHFKFRCEGDTLTISR